MPQETIYGLCQKWEETVRSSQRNRHYFYDLLREIEFHAELRFTDYEPFADREDAFPVRLMRWITQLNDPRHQRALLELVPWIMFIDKREMRSIYRDAYRRIIAPWITETPPSIDEQLQPDYEIERRKRLRQFCFYSITESFAHKQFENANSLSGLRKPTILGENLSRIPTLLASRAAIAGHIVLEDVVGSGNQAARVLATIAETLGETARILFVPLIMLERQSAAQDPLCSIRGVSIRPAVVVPRCFCLTDKPHPREPALFKRVRAIVKATRQRVCKPLNDVDEPPDGVFGYQGTGALLVTHQNTPNNTLPLIHHKAPDWDPLFRRSHHFYGKKP